jgi:hypothetical protein
MKRRKVATKIAEKNPEVLAEKGLVVGNKILVLSVQGFVTCIWQVGGYRVSYRRYSRGFYER